VESLGAIQQLFMHLVTLDHGAFGTLGDVMTFWAKTTPSGQPPPTDPLFPSLQTLRFTERHFGPDDESAFVQLPLAAPKLRHLSLRAARFPNATLAATLPQFAASLTYLDLSHDGGVYVEEHVVDDALIALVLATLPLLEHLDVGSHNWFSTSVAFASAAFARDNCVAPRLRSLSVARQRSLNRDGLQTIVRVCPCIAQLDIRGCFGISLRDFAAVLVVPRAQPAPEQAASTTTRGPLRLPNLRRVVASYRRRVPRVLNFITYHCGNYGKLEWQRAENDNRQTR
jgi:hypothetical protein